MSQNNKDVWHPITPSRKGLVKSVTRKSCKAAANKSWQSKKIQPHVQRKICKELKKEVKVLQSRTTNFHQTRPIDVKSLSWKHLEGKLQQRAFFLYSILMSLTETSSSCSNRSAIICVIVAVILKFRYPKMILIQKVISCVLYAGHCSKQVIPYSRKLSRPITFALFTIF